MKKILFITQKRNDAIGIVDESIKKELKKISHPFDFLEIHEKGKGIFNVIKNYIINIILLRKKCFKYDKIYFTRENPYGILVRMLYWRKYIVMTIHHVEDYWGKTIVGKLIFETTNLFIAISEFTKSQLVELGVNKNKILVNYNGISDIYYPEPIKDFTDYPYILYVGTEVPRKNTNLLLEVFSEVHKKCPELKLVKIGKPGLEEDKIRFDNKVKELGLEDTVIIKRNFIEDDELRKWYSNALCYISLSKLEGFGLTIPEAMACGCTVITSDIGPFREICNNDDMIVDLKDKEKIVKSVIKICNDDGYRKELATKGENTSKKFSREKNTNILLKIINN